MHYRPIILLNGNQVKCKMIIFTQGSAAHAMFYTNLYNFFPSHFSFNEQDLISKSFDFIYDKKKKLKSLRTSFKYIEIPQINGVHLCEHTKRQGRDTLYVYIKSVWFMWICVYVSYLQNYI